MPRKYSLTVQCNVIHQSLIQNHVHFIWSHVRLSQLYIKAVVKLKPEKYSCLKGDLNPWPLQYHCSALQSELSFSAVQVIIYYIFIFICMYILYHCAKSSKSMLYYHVKSLHNIHVLYMHWIISPNLWISRWFLKTMFGHTISKSNFNWYI